METVIIIALAMYWPIAILYVVGKFYIPYTRIDNDSFAEKARYKGNSMEWVTVPMKNDIRKKINDRLENDE